MLSTETHLNPDMILWLPLLNIFNNSRGKDGSVSLSIGFQFYRMKATKGIVSSWAEKVYVG